jgi:hypothetical protein
MTINLKTNTETEDRILDMQQRHPIDAQTISKNFNEAKSNRFSLNKQVSDIKEKYLFL